jgi:hypothetical protein
MPLQAQNTRGFVGHTCVSALNLMALSRRVGFAIAKPTTTSSKYPTQAPNWGLFLIPKAEAFSMF